MKRSRLTEEQIIGVLWEQEARVATAEVCRRHGVSSPQVPRAVHLTALPPQQDL